MKQYTTLFIFLFIVRILNGQSDTSDDFYFSTIEEEVVSMINNAREAGEENPAEKLRLAANAYEISLLEDLTEKQVDALTTMGSAYFDLFEIDKSLEYLNQSYKLAQNINYEEGLRLAAYTLGTVHAFLGDRETAISYFKESDNLIASGNEIQHIYVYRELAKLYKSSRSYEQAVSMASDALKLAEALKEKNSIMEISLLLGDLEFNAGNIRKAVKLFRDVINRTTVNGSFQNKRASAHSYIGKCYALLGEYHLALANGQDGLLLSVKNDSDSGRLEAYESLSFIYQHMDDYKRAYNNLKLYYDQKAYMEEQKSAENLDKIKAYYGNFQKEQEIDKQQLQIESQNRLILAGSLLIGLFIILLVIFYLLYKKNSRIAEKLSQDLKKEMIISKTDPITGLPNRREMEELIQRSISLWKKEYVNFSLLFLSIEKYKKVDSQWGGGAGSKLQKFIGKILESELKGQDIISVWKPFVFLILLPETDQESLYSVRQKISLRFSREIFNYENEKKIIEVIMGSCTYSGEENRSSCIDRCRKDLEEQLN